MKEKCRKEEREIEEDNCLKERRKKKVVELKKWEGKIKKKIVERKEEIEKGIEGKWEGKLKEYVSSKGEKTQGWSMKRWEINWRILISWFSETSHTDNAKRF